MKSEIAEKMFTFFELCISDLKSVPFKPKPQFETALKDDSSQQQIETFTIPQI
jgi:hypothetical protein